MTVKGYTVLVCQMSKPRGLRYSMKIIVNSVVLYAGHLLHPGHTRYLCEMIGMLMCLTVVINYFTMYNKTSCTS
jgi:hypothetical protein